MRLLKLGLLVLGLTFISWGAPTTVQASDVEQSNYSVVLTPTSRGTGGGATLTTGSSGDTVNNGSDQSATGNSGLQNSNGGQGATVSSIQGQDSSRGNGGRLPQTSEAWFGLGSMVGVILLLLVWVGLLLRRKNNHS